MYMIRCKLSLTCQGMKCDIITNVELVYLRLSVASLQICEQGGWLQRDKIQSLFRVQSTDIPYRNRTILWILQQVAMGEHLRYRHPAEFREKAEGVPCMVETRWSWSHLATLLAPRGAISSRSARTCSRCFLAYRSEASAVSRSPTRRGLRSSHSRWNIDLPSSHPRHIPPS